MIAAERLTAGDRVLISGLDGGVRASVVRIYTHANVGRGTAAGTVRNSALQILAIPGAHQAALVFCATGVPMFLVELAGCWRDVTGRALLITPLEPPTGNPTGLTEA